MATQNVERLMGPPMLRGSNSRGARSWKSPSRMMGFALARRASSSSRSMSISYCALKPGGRAPTHCTTGFGSQRPPPDALQIAEARQSGYAASSSDTPAGAGSRGDDGDGDESVWTRGDVWARMSGRRMAEAAVGDVEGEIGDETMAEPSRGVGGERGEEGQ